MMEQRNLIIAIALSIAILLGFQVFYEPQRKADRAQPSPGAPSTATVPARPGAPPTEPAGPAAPVLVDRAKALAQSPRLPIRSPRINGSVALAGGQIDDVTLPDYRESVDPKSAPITLLSPVGAEHAYYAEFGWVAPSGGVALPGRDAKWTADGGDITADKATALSWDNGQGQRFTNTWRVDANFMFTVTQSVKNDGDKPITIFPYGLVSRTGEPHTGGYYILHEGPIGVLDGSLKEYSYKDLRGDKKLEQSTTGGWLGITDKYWLVALVPDQKAVVKTRFSHADAGAAGAAGDKYQADYLGEGVTIPPGGTGEVSSRLFAGAKEVKLLDAYEKQLGIPRFDLAVDFGWFYFLTKPIFFVLDWLYGLIGNFGLSILLLTVCVKALMFPLANKSYRSMSKMKKLQPEMVKLRERFGEDRQRMNQEMMALYKRAQANPAAGCLPIVVQIPVFFSLYKVLFVTIEMRHAPFFGWIRDLSAEDPTTLFNLFGLIPWTPPEFLHFGAWPLLMGITMFLQTKLNPQPADPIQAKVFLFMPLVFTVMLARFPAGLVIYWAWNNLLSIAQQWVIMKREGAPTT